MNLFQLESTAFREALRIDFERSQASRSELNGSISISLNDLILKSFLGMFSNQKILKNGILVTQDYILIFLLAINLTNVRHGGILQEIFLDGKNLVI